MRYREAARKLPRLGCYEVPTRSCGSHRRWFNPQIAPDSARQRLSRRNRAAWNLLVRERRNSHTGAGVFDGQSTQPAGSVHLQQRVLVQIARLVNLSWIKLDVQSVGIRKNT